MRTFCVGGAVRDTFLGRPSDDIDFAVEADSFEAMKQGIINSGHTIFMENPEFLTIRARHDETRQTHDFVLCRSDGPSSDHRRPDTVTPGTIYDDLSRRDFTMNAIAIGDDGSIIDPHGGRSDIERRVIRTVGDPVERFVEDGLRPFRAVRFAVTLGFDIDIPGHVFFKDVVIEAMQSVARDRVRVELNKMFEHDSARAIRIINAWMHVPSVFTDGLRLQATQKG